MQMAQATSGRAGTVRIGHAPPPTRFGPAGIAAVQPRSVQRALTIEDAEMVGEAIGTMIADFRWGFWECRHDGTWAWHGGLEGRAGFVNAHRTRRGDWNLFHYPVYYPQGYWEIDNNGTLAWQAGIPGGLLVSANRDVNAVSGATYAVHGTWRAVFLDWLRRSAVAATAGDPGRGRRANQLQGGDTFKFWWFGGVHLNGGAYGLGIDLHFNGNLGSCWIQGGPDLSVNKQDNPVANALELRLKRLAKHGWPGNGDTPLIVFADRRQPWVLDANI